MFSDVPAKIDAHGRYLVYLHGRIIEDRGRRPTHPRFGTYEYDLILETFAARGFAVISEERRAGTDPQEYAIEVADQVSSLLAAGVAPERVTVVGFSKGGVIAILASSELGEPHVNFVFIAACGPWMGSVPDLAPAGRLLVIREATDDLAGPCDALFKRQVGGGERSEVVLHLGGGHGAFYRPHPEWIEPIVEWALAASPSS